MKMSSKFKMMVGVGLIALVALVYVQSTSAQSTNWTEPSSNPPASNLKAPLNTGPIWQAKDGGLAVNVAGNRSTALLANGNVFANGAVRLYARGSQASGPYLQMGMVNDTAGYNEVDGMRGPWIYAFDHVPGVSNMNGSIGVRVGNQGPDSAFVVGRGHNQYANILGEAFLSKGRFRIGMVTNNAEYQKVDNTQGPWIYAFDVSPNAPSLAGSIVVRADGSRSGNAGLIVGKGKGQFADVWAANFRRGSDVRLKKDIKTVENALQRLENIRGVEYKLKSNDQKNIGVIAQEIEKDFPSLVNEGPNGYKMVDYDGLVGVLVEAVKEQQKEIRDLQAKVAELEK